jgi:hypothetical protein
MGKTRDRNYEPHLKIVRDVVNGFEIVYIIDNQTGYLEGMNENGIGVLNSALLVSDDEKAVGSYLKRSKKKGSSNDGPRVLRALGMPTLKMCIQSLVGYDGGIKGHTFVGSPRSLYVIELTSKNNPIVKRLDPSTGFDVRTNHGIDHPDAGYTLDKQPDDYISSKIRKVGAETALDGSPSTDGVMPSLATQHFSHGSNLNMLRRTDSMRSSSQVLLNLDERELVCYYFPDECKFLGIDDRTPPGHEPQVSVRVIKYNEG